MKSTLRRLTRLEAAEAARPESLRRWHRIIIQEGEDPAPMMAAMIASGEAQQGDQFIVRVIMPVSPARHAGMHRA